MKKTNMKNTIQNDLKNELTNEQKTNPDLIMLVDKKMKFFQDVIQKTMLHVNHNKSLNILGVSEVNNCIQSLTSFSKRIKEPIHTDQIDNIINSLQIINNELSTLFKTFGTHLLDDLLFICFGSSDIKTYTSNNLEKSKFELLRKYFHPISYKVVNPKTPTPNLEGVKHLDCIDISLNVKQFHLKVYGIQVLIHNNTHNRSLIISGIVDDAMIDLLNNAYLENLTNKIMGGVPDDSEFKTETFNKFIKTLILKDYLINDYTDIYSKYMGYVSNLTTLNQKTLACVVKEFISNNLFIKRNTIMILLINTVKNDNQYMAYLLYDLLSNDANGSVDTQEQITMFDSFPLVVKQYFRDAMKKTIQYTNELSDFDVNKIPIEQQICLMNVTDNVKEKAMQKLKEVKSKSEDSCSKARQYLDGLLKIPFNIYRKEPMLCVMDNIKNHFKDLISKYDKPLSIKQTNFTNIEIMKYVKSNINKLSTSTSIEHYKSVLTNTSSKSELINTILKINVLIEANSNNLTNCKEIKYKNKSNDFLKKTICTFVDECYLKNVTLLDELTNNDKYLLVKELNTIQTKYSSIINYTNEIKTVLDDAVYGHTAAKKQVERIIGQWINGEQDGYCFGFEGPPGVGKTSLAKRGLSGCLKDENGESRPFSMIQMGGDSNGSSLHGHNYTYVGSTWGSIVQILIDNKCMNPIIFIDEIDKISKTEHGKEIIGILTHLLDPSQNDCFQDKYFTGIDLNLSKALFILSYNDVDAIDKILLDRIHRIRFNSLTIEDKLVISRTHILPEIYKKMGLTDIIDISEPVMKYIIENYTSEPGVRKLKEVLFEIIAEINLDILKSVDYDIPIVITVDEIKTKYFKDKHELSLQKIHSAPTVGIINGLWANAIEQGGVLPIQASFYPSEKMFEMKLTGQLGAVMLESMSVAFTLAWNLTPVERHNYLLVTKEHKKQGIHIHCPDGSTQKEGPSAGTAVTVVMYSILNNKKIKNNIAITGEITLQGNVTEIGGLKSKVLGAFKAGVKEIIYPEDNHKDYLLIADKYKDSGMIFHKVSKIEEVLELVFE